jgi:hypothetical protein
MYPTTMITFTFTDLIEQPQLFKPVLKNLLNICESEIEKQKVVAVKPSTRRKKKVVQEEN